MKIKINNKKLMEAKVDLTKFKKVFSLNLDLKHAVDSATKIEYKMEGMTEEIAKKSIYWNIDWRAVIEAMKEFDDNEMIVKICPCKVEGLNTYEPRQRTEDEFEFYDKVIDGDDIILIQSFIQNPDHNIDTYIKNKVYPYGDKEWKIKVDLRDLK